MMDNPHIAATNAIGVDDEHRRRFLNALTEALRELAKSCGQNSVDDLKQRFNGLGKFPELHST